MKKPTNLKDALKGKLSKKEFEQLVTAYDVVGDIGIIEIPDSLVKKEKVIGRELLELRNDLKVVCKKAGGHIGEFRLQKYKVIAGEKRKETVYKENGVRLKLHIEKTYFSPRLATERNRIMEIVKKGERVLVMFSGVGPYPIVIAKNSKVGEVYGVEINPDAHKYALENIILNKLDNVKLYNGNVRKIVPRLKKKFDRVLMPLPKGAEGFLDVALKAVRKKGVVHFYDFLHEDFIDVAVEKVKEACIVSGKKCRVLKTVKCGQHSPRVYRICVDFRVL